MVFKALQLCNWKVDSPWLLKCWGPEGSGLCTNNQCDTQLVRFTVEDFQPVFPCCLRGLDLFTNKKWASKIPGECISGDSWSCCIGVYKSKMANGFRFFWVNKNISSCQVVTSWASCEYFAVSPAGSGTSERRLRWEGIFHIRSSGAQVTTFGLDYTGQHLRGWGIWSFVYMV